MFGNIWAIRLFIVFFLCSCSYGNDQEKIPYRSDCIVKVIILIDETEKENLENIINKIARALIDAGSRGFSESRPEIAINHNDRKSIYLQYKDKCTDKKNITNELFDEYVVPYISESFSYEISEEVIYPSTDTIDAQGDFWRD